MQKMTNCLWFDGQAEDAMNFYLSVFKTSKAGAVSRYGKNAPRPEGSVMVASFEINGQNFMALNGGPHFKFTPAISFVVNCDTQAEIDDLWDKLGAGGAPQQCGWLTDKFGVSWQVVPSILGDLMKTANAAQSGRVMSAFMQMTKFDIAKLQQAYDQG
jgi:predicted 3-demethylubiquinone-9 3-methyltransferase (glyoxalase superfamily)